MKKQIVFSMACPTNKQKKALSNRLRKLNVKTGKSRYFLVAEALRHIEGKNKIDY